jgi:hypothetical protein
VTGSPFTHPEGGVAKDIREIVGLAPPPTNTGSAGSRPVLRPAPVEPEGGTVERELLIDVYGRPVATRSSGVGWRETVKQTALETIATRAWEPLAGAVEVQVIFHLRRPVSAPKSKTAPFAHSNDVLKLVRPVLDVLVEAGAITHEGLVVDLHAQKRFAVERAPGATVVIREEA